MNNHVYCDGLQDVSIVSGVVRVDFFHYAPGAPGADGKPRREHAMRVCMSPDAFVQSYSVLDRVVRELETRGMVSRRGDSGPSTTPAPVATPAPRSANF